MLTVAVIVFIALFLLFVKQRDGFTGMAESVAEPDTDYPGNDIKNGNGSLETARKECQKTPGCVGFNWNRNTKDYWIKNTLGAKTKSVGFDFYKVNKEVDTDYPGNDIKEKSGKGSLEQARQVCETTPECVGFNWNRNNNDFWIKHTLGARTKSPGYNFYKKTAAPAASAAPAPDTPAPSVASTGSSPLKSNSYYEFEPTDKDNTFKLVRIDRPA